MLSITRNENECVRFLIRTLRRLMHPYRVCMFPNKAAEGFALLCFHLKCTGKKELKLAIFVHVLCV